MTLGDRYLVIGSGSIARRHISNLRKIYIDSEIACVSASGRLLNHNETEATVLFSDLASAISWQPSFAIVASPAPFHVSNAVDLLKNGIPVLVEKPFCDSIKNIIGNEKLLSDNLKNIEVGYNLRHLSSAKRMKELIDSDAVGQIHSISIDMGQYLPNWRPASDYRLNVSARKDLGGGVLLELSHEFDYLTWLFGKFDEVYCLLSNSGKLEIDVEDKADIIISRDDGLIAHLHMDFLQRKATRCCKVIGEQGNLVWDLIANSIKLQTENGTGVLFNDPEFDRNEMYIEQLRRFAIVAKGHALPLVGLNEALYTMSLIEAMRDSSTQRRPVSLRGLL